jgi:hypothetical protein
MNKVLAMNNWNSLAEQIRINLGYTHLAYGILQANDGLVDEPNHSGHFGFYESNQANLGKSFQIVDQI